MTNKEKKLREILEKYKNQLSNLWRVKIPYPVKAVEFQFEAIKEILELDSFWHEYYKDIITQINNDHKEEIARYKTAAIKVVSILSALNVPNPIEMEILDIAQQALKRGEK